MPRAYSVDLRERVLRAQAAGMAAPEIERTLGISRRTVARWNARVRHGDALTPNQSPGRSRKIPPDQEDALRAQVAAHRDATLAQHCRRWQADHGVAVSAATMCRRLAALHLPRKKSHGPPANKTRPNAPPSRPKLRPSSHPT